MNTPKSTTAAQGLGTWDPESELRLPVRPQSLGVTDPNVTLHTCTAEGLQAVIKANPQHTEVLQEQLLLCSTLSERPCNPCPLFHFSVRQPETFSPALYQNNHAPSLYSEANQLGQNPAFWPSV